ncbi:helix-turn-helix transcriptional regulator [Paractinoplanes atraurantiacus]|uniref:AraC family transcriptional regulator, L-rhamnose operon transcriptional activator RhaR n=1 Tax=Paractinoplanes atraurantiacus TaxID=1036182 RepID=A0A285I2L6_9ACTN|nr:AraC family transcriptional regulator [Actinoplanes atraurantiacus]SNY41201.1 AraC family transcriptional regulator, L-rhamnose operon transcriptional activator RhaR [Actinoplanes atraurantiacus]
MTDEPPVETTGTLLHFIEGSAVWAGHYLHEDAHPVHTHSFVEIAVMTGGKGTHHSLAGDRDLSVGDVVLLRPGVWHGYEQCEGLDLYNCCFSTELMQRELAWTRQDRQLGHLLWTGPYSGQRRGILYAHLEADALAVSLEHLDGLQKLRSQPPGRYRGDMVGRLVLFLSTLARVVAESDDLDGDAAGIHPAVLDAMRMMEARPGHQWTLTELAAELHLAPGYLVRLFKSATGLPPMAYLSRHRVELAAARLLHTDQPINKIGESVGWPDQNYFARRFKSHYGLSASTYRSRFTRTVKR